MIFPTDFTELTFKKSEGMKEQLIQNQTKSLLHLPHAGFQHADPERGWLEASLAGVPFPTVYRIYFDSIHCPESRGSY